MDKEQEGEERQPSDLRPVQVDLGRKSRSARREQKSATKENPGSRHLGDRNNKDAGAPFMVEARASANPVRLARQELKPTKRTEEIHWGKIASNVADPVSNRLLRTED